MSNIDYKPGPSIEDLPPALRRMAPLKLASNENMLGPSPGALAAIEAALPELHLYPARQLDGAVRQAIVTHLGAPLTPDHLILGNGGLEVLELAARHFLADPAAECLLPSVTFPFLARYCRAMDRPMVFYELDPDEFSYSVDAILAAVTERTGLVYVCNPNNPTGTTMSAAQLDALVAELPPHALLIHDEAYVDFHEAPDFPDAVGHVLDGRNLFIVHTFSKLYGLAGLRFGYGVGPPTLIAALDAYRRAFHLNKVALAGALGALADTAHRDRTLAMVADGRRWLADALRALGCRVWPSHANFVLFSPPRQRAAALADALLAEAIIVRLAFGLDNHIRLTVGTPEQNRRVVAALAAILDGPPAA